MIGELKTEIGKLIGPILSEEAFDLVEIKLSRYKKKYRLQVFIDSDHGVGIDDCARFSGLIGTALDVSNLISDSYILEVSSPGLERPLRSEADFRRRIGRNMQVDMVEEGYQRSIRGVLSKVRGERLYLTGDEGNFEVALTDVVQGRELI
jgi:ribosome maturation factor RimP